MDIITILRRLSDLENYWLLKIISRLLVNDFGSAQKRVKEMFSHYYVYSDIRSLLKYSKTLYETIMLMCCY